MDSRILNTESEKSNENFKNGMISIIVTTNKRRQSINEKKLETLIKYKKEYICCAEDRSTNLENPPEVPENSSITQTGGLENKLKVKKGAPIVITSNHSKAKYKEDGIVNGARGYVDSVQFSRNNSENIEVIWVVFKDKNVEKLLRYDYKHLNKLHQPENIDAVPIMKQKKYFTLKTGEVKYQRTQFPMTLGYAVTSYKCQGDTLDEVIVDFRHEAGESSLIQWGSFYVALTRVKEGKKVFLKCFEESYITYNKKVEEKIAEMRKFKSYKFKKIYLMDPIYEDSSKEFKLGYFNIRGFMEGQHAEYLDNDKNLQNLDILVLSETWLTHDVPNKNVINTLNNWKILKRLDATDNIKHMGLMLLIPQKSAKSQSYLYSLDYFE